MKEVYIADLAIFLPEQQLDNHAIEERILVGGHAIKKGLIKKIFGNEFRHFAHDDTQVSDLACSAGEIIVKRTATKIDLLIFAAASSDLIEPATANIVQQKLGLHCAAMDIKNACNSVVSAMEVATAYIRAGMYSNILIVNGEKLSQVINFNPRDNQHLMKCLPGYSLGDAGAALLINASGGSKIHFQKAMTWGLHWDLCTVAGGGSRYFRNSDKYFFEGKTSEMNDVFETEALPYVLRWIQESKWDIDDIDCLACHQVSVTSTQNIANALGVPYTKCISTFERYGNTAAASIPLALHQAVIDKQLKKGDQLMIIGLAAGISISIQLVTW